MIVGNEIWTPLGENFWFVRANFTPRKVDHKKFADLSADAAGSQKAQTVADLSAEVKSAMRERLHNGRGGLSLQEWDDFLADMEELGIITHDERFYANGTLCEIPEAVHKYGSAILDINVPGKKSDIWKGDPLSYLDNMDVYMLKNQLYANMGCSYNIGLSGQRSAYQKVAQVVREILR